MTFTIELQAQLIKLLQKMVDLTFQGLFLTTNKGIPDLDNLPQSTTLAKPFYVSSVLLQVCFFLFFFLYFALSIFRVIKKIKNSRFEDVPDVDAAEQQNAKNNSQKNEDQQNENEKEDKLIYRFDDEDEEQEDQKKGKEKGKEKDQQGSQVQKSQHIKQKQDEEVPKEESYEDYHDVNEDAFIELDDKLLFMQPLLISFIVCNSLFAADPSTIIFFILTIVSFLAFNIKGKCANTKATQVFFLIFSILGFLAFFYNDHDLTT